MKTEPNQTVQRMPLRVIADLIRSAQAMIVTIPLLVLFVGGSVLLGVFGPAAEHKDARVFWRKQIAVGPLVFLGAACLLPFSYLLAGRNLGVYYFLPALTYSVLLLIASAIGIFVTRGRRLLIWVAALTSSMLPVLYMLSSSPHGP